MDKRIDEMSDIELVGELWRRRLECLWKYCEFSEGKRPCLE